MHALAINGREIPLNANGLLLNFEDWNEDVARAMTEEDGIELSDCHWAAIRFMREYYQEFEVPPSPKTMVREVGHKLVEYGKCNGKKLQELFPRGGCKHACKIAGLPMEYCHSC